ncbi:zinc-dependent metalloprotease [Cellvibrio sp. OA-2007]|uniref:zinc-dependent metalloprotease n=1 Tax=Cellvibrio sp. OA-2007 TaxID=529823 RepID=UPI000783496E|nr:zinc-dependent metalloprotease [Cellvibrio sp. OA-2007]
MKPYAQKLIRIITTALLATTALPALAASTAIDVLVVYTKGAANLYGGDPTTRINQLFQVTNQIYADSGVDLEIRVARTLQVDYTDDNNAETALNNITFNQHAAFSGVAAARDQAKADMVLFYRPYMTSHGSCGVAWVGGSNGTMSAGHKAYMFAHVAINSCGDFVTAHELGHNMGLKHSRKQDGTGGAMHYALGHGVVNSFTTVMAYQNEFNVDYWNGKVYKFSNPDIICKNNLPCGVDRNNTSTGADARYALNITAPQIANFYAGAPASSTASVSSSKSSVALSSSKSSSSASSVNTGDALVLKSKVESARAVHSAAAAVLAANKVAVTEKTAAERAAKTELTTVTRTLTTATRGYETAVVKYNALVVKVEPLQTQLNTAIAAYNSAATDAAKASRLTAYNNLVTRYNTLLEQISAAASAVNTAQQQIAPATSAVATATNIYDAAVAATAAEKARTADLTTAVADALALFKALDVEYKAALRLCKCTV